MKLIGAGLARTATTTQMVALEMLGIGRCYHMRNMLQELPTSVPLWEDARDGNADWAAIFGDCTTTVDWPSAYFYRELMDVYPDAKVLLSVRDGAAWEASMRETVYAMFYGDSVMAHVLRARYHVDPLWRRYMDVVRSISFEQRGPYAGSHHDRESLIAAAERWNDEVKATVPADRLVVWQPADGWEPICEALGVPVPDEPLPHVNDTQGFKDMLIGGSLGSLNAWWEQTHPAEG